MAKNLLFIVFIASLASQELGASPSPEEREGKVLSLFNVVQFNNDACSSNVRLQSGGSKFMEGTCFTASECQGKGGKAQGVCAAGFGVCCLFLVQQGGMVTKNSSYLQNPGYPDLYDKAEAVTYTVKKVSSKICSLRLDFEEFTILGIPGTEELDTDICQDAFDVKGVLEQKIPTICGENTNQHMYVELGPSKDETAALNFIFDDAATSSMRKWNIQVSQLRCDQDTIPPQGCLQYFTGVTGRITTFNFANSKEIHLPNQDYSICFRPEVGFCCVQYRTCSDVDPLESFSLSLKPADSASHDSTCTEDFSNGAGVGFNNRYCGAIFSAQSEATVHSGVCSCLSPFTVGIFTDEGNDVTTPLSRVCTSQDGPDGSRNALGQVLFPSNVATRSTRSETAGVVSPHLPYAANTLVDNGIAMWNKFPALREASTKRMAS
eukprot:maker-scaffold252_size238019-snap-gene-1.34 protein:Tk06195 transcript:maker-scaffold252_size238019-snap-gene-1.34-mRNA-1 annotation:"hypothetical protein SINV_00302"